MGNVEVCLQVGIETEVEGDRVSKDMYPWVAGYSLWI